MECTQLPLGPVAREEQLAHHRQMLKQELTGLIALHWVRLPMAVAVAVRTPWLQELVAQAGELGRLLSGLRGHRVRLDKVTTVEMATRRPRPPPDAPAVAVVELILRGLLLHTTTLVMAEQA